MTTNTFSKKILAALVSVISAAGLMFTLSTTTFASAESVGSNASVGTVPTCVWQLSGVSDTVTLTHPNAAGGGDVHTSYVGEDFKLTGSSSKQAKIYVGPAGQTSASTTDVDNCSFYNSGGLGVSNTGAKAQLEMTDAVPSFTAVHVTEDAAMTFALDGAKSSYSSQLRNLSLTISPTQCVNTNVGTGSADNWVKESGTTGLNSTTSPI